MGRHKSRGLEDENKNKKTLENLKRMVKVLTGSTKKGPPPRNTAAAPVKPIAQSREAGDNRPTHLKGKPLPYVEIAPINLICIHLRPFSLDMVQVLIHQVLSRVITTLLITVEHIIIMLFTATSTFFFAITCASWFWRCTTNST